MEVVLLLNTKKIPLDMQNKFGDIYPLDIPYNQKTIKDYLFLQYKDSDKVVIVNECSEGKNDKKIERLSAKGRYELTLLSKESQTLYEVIKNSLQELAAVISEDYSLTINFGDTIISEATPTFVNDYLYVGDTSRQAPWDYVSRSEGCLLFNKKGSDTGILDQTNAVSGVFHLSSAKNFLDSCLSILKDKKNFLPRDKGLDPFYEALTYYDKKYHSLKLITTENWLDFGHVEEYLETKKIVQARFFNEISIDEQRGIITKKSQNVEKFVGEIQWYLKLPNKLQYLTPRIYDSSVVEKIPYIEMEYYPYETMHNLYIYGNLEYLFWEQSIEKLLFIRQELQEHSGTDQVLNAKDLSAIYLDKTVSRVNELLKTFYFSSFKEIRPIINGVEYPNLIEVLHQLEEILTVHGVLEEKPATIIHGDFCISNILYDVESKIVKLIDPRGKFGSKDIYGDEQYDVAKLLHSFEGSYDHIITDRFSITDHSETAFDYIINKSSQQEKISLLVSSKISKRYDITRLRLIEGLLFLSMIPLHSDYPERQKIMYGQAMKLLVPYLGETR